MLRSTLHGRRIHIAGSVAEDTGVASEVEVQAASEFIRELVIALMCRGATFVIPVDADKRRASDNAPITFDWLVWETVNATLARRPAGALTPLAVAVQHHKTEEQIPADKADLWDRLRLSDLVSIDNASHWNMASKRMEAQASHGEVLVTLGGSEGVLYLANLYHQRGKPVIPLNFALCTQDTGSRRLFNQALARQSAGRFFRTVGAATSHDWINRLNFSARHDVAHRVATVVNLLEALEQPTVFGVRLLNSKAAEFHDVENFFTGVVQDAVNQLGYALKVVDGGQPNEHARIDDEIFKKLHHSAVVVADITGSRPNCLIELGYALGRSIPLMMTACRGTEFPFDVKTLPGHPWDPTDTLPEQRRKFLVYWHANIRRPPLVAAEPLIP